MFENLLSNILKYALPGTRVYIDLFEDEYKVNIIMKNISAYEMDEDLFKAIIQLNKSASIQ